ncbi:unnamed protein product, partial [Prorocentrum cordatum]
SRLGGARARPRPPAGEAPRALEARGMSFAASSRADAERRGGRQPARGCASLETSARSSTSILDILDFSALGEEDPSLADGHRAVYDREVPFELRVQDAGVRPDEAGTLDAMRCKILLLGEEHDPENIRIEITSKNDIFFHYAHSVDAHGFRSMQDQQKLMIEFPDYLSVLIRMLNSCIMDPHVYLAVLAMRQDGSARLDFVQNLEYKFIELLSCDFLASSEEMVRQQVTFQYNSMSRRLEAMKTHLQDISELVKVKNPSLLLQLKRAARPRAGAAR